MRFCSGRLKSCDHPMGRFAALALILCLITAPNGLFPLAASASSLRPPRHHSHGRHYSAAHQQHLSYRPATNEWALAPSSSEGRDGDRPLYDVDVPFDLSSSEDGIDAAKGVTVMMDTENHRLTVEEGVPDHHHHHHHHHHHEAAAIQKCTRGDLEQINGWLIDLDGTMYVPGHLIEGAQSFHTWLIQKKKGYVYLSNTPAKGGAGVIAKFKSDAYRLNPPPGESNLMSILRV
uniref:Uncharacterized protein n=1 Tax=Vitrella brassicaformis TaxID=1169539 RepID=A0A7S1P6T5_9ALVE|mmetsp:Transcript_36830/g.92334  ORF Transcript_36830/g.92334 Transcript_36830/m.92334 type:complete len:233 (+) Transcript_36830:84-782(+)